MSPLRPTTFPPFDRPLLPWALFPSKASPHLPCQSRPFAARTSAVASEPPEVCRNVGVHASALHLLAFTSSLQAPAVPGSRPSSASGRPLALRCLHLGARPSGLRSRCRSPPPRRLRPTSAFLGFVYVKERVRRASLSVVTGSPRQLRSEERRVGKSVDLGGRRIIKKKKQSNIKLIIGVDSQVYILRTTTILSGLIRYLYQP